jgi:hypothetical protein
MDLEDVLIHADALLPQKPLFGSSRSRRLRDLAIEPEHPHS